MPWPSLTTFIPVKTDRFVQATFDRLQALPDGVDVVIREILGYQHRHFMKHVMNETFTSLYD